MSPLILSQTQRDHVLREGDIIFSRIPNALYRRICAATNSPTSHVGILFRDSTGDWIVAESKVPCVRFSSLDNFLDRSANGWHTVRRLKRVLAPADVAALRRECENHMGTLYHTGFRYESRRMFCSKFVHEVFRSALNIPVGRLETFADLLHRQPGTALNFWRWWFFGHIPWQRLTVTPASQLEDPGLETIWESHPACLRANPAGMPAPTMLLKAREQP